MTVTRAIGLTCNKVILAIVRALALWKIHPNTLTFIGLLINIGAAVLLAAGQFRWAALVGALVVCHCEEGRSPHVAISFLQHCACSAMR